MWAMVRQAFLSMRGILKQRRRQHGRINDPEMIWIAHRLFAHLELDEQLYPASFSAFRKQWDAVMRQLGIPYRQSERGATPGVRGSGATFLYSSSEDVSWVAWRGRWARVRTLEILPSRGRCAVVGALSG